MKVTINGHLLTVSWHYESNKINKLMIKKGLSKEDFIGKSKKEICEILGLSQYPLPETTHCVILNEATGDRFVGTVKRYVKDPWNREEARKKALHNAVWELFPLGDRYHNGGEHNHEHSLGRRKFWDAYHNRVQTDGKATIDKLLKLNIFSLKDLDDYVKSKEVLIHSSFY